MAGNERRMKTWLWVLGGLVVVLAIVLAVVLLTDNGDDTTPAATSSTSTTQATTTTTTTPATTTSTIPATTTTTVPLPALTDDPQTYAQYLYATWQNNNRTAAANVASADAVNQMFSQAAPAKGPYVFSNCDPAAGSLYCTWNGQNGASIQMQVRTITGGLPIQVEQVTFSP